MESLNELVKKMITQITNNSEIEHVLLNNLPIYIQYGVDSNLCIVKYIYWESDSDILYPFTEKDLLDYFIVPIMMKISEKEEFSFIENNVNNTNPIKLVC